MASSTPFKGTTFHRMVPYRRPNPSHSVEEMATGIHIYTYPTCSLYGIFTNICPNNSSPSKMSVFIDQHHGLHMAMKNASRRLDRPLHSSSSSLAAGHLNSPRTSTKSRRGFRTCKNPRCFLCFFGKTKKNPWSFRVWSFFPKWVGVSYCS